MIRKALHTLFVVLFLVYAVAPIWLEVGLDDAVFAAEEAARGDGLETPRLLIDRCILHADQEESAPRSSSLSAHQDEGSGILLRKKRALVSSKKPVEPPATEAAPAPTHFDLQISSQPQQPARVKLAAFISFAYYHSGCSPPRS